MFSLAYLEYLYGLSDLLTRVLNRHLLSISVG